MKKLIGIMGVSLLLISCGGKTQKQKATQEKAPVVETQMTPNQNMAQYGVGDIVPSDKVCMVNDEYMGRDQIEVLVDDKMYYGCCEMCEDLLPKDPTVRVAIDPISKNEVDKALAVIAITGDRGQVSYFESEDTYKKYIANH